MKKIHASLTFLTLVPLFQVEAATISLSGAVVEQISDDEGNPLEDNSIVQVGYLPGLSSSDALSDSNSIANIDWDSFVAVTGVGSANSSGYYDTRISSFLGAGTFFGENLSFDENDAIFGGLPVRIAVRVFDTMIDPSSAGYNTFTSSSDSFILEELDSLNPNAGRADFSINTADDLGLIWEDDPFTVNNKIPPVVELEEFYESAEGEALSIDSTPVSGSPDNFVYQWYFNDVAVDPADGGGESSLNLEGVTSENGTWKIVVSNAAGSAEHSFEYRVFSDVDGDGLSDYREQTFLGTNYASSDTDADGLLDGDELSVTNTDPTIADSDNNGVIDGEDDLDSDGLNNAQEIYLYQTNPFVADTDGDGFNDLQEVNASLDPNVATDVSDILERLTTLQSDYTDLQSDYATVEAERDARFLDSDGDGITDVKEGNLETEVGEVTVFYLQSAYDFANAESLQAGRDEVTVSPQNFGLTTLAAYEAVVAQRDALFADSDGDGLTDEKETELATNAEEETTFYLESSYNWAVTNARESAQSEILANPQAYSLRTEAAYNFVVAQRDARFLDTDGDGLTDDKEGELASNSEEATVFYLQNALDSAVSAAKAEGRDEVTTNPSNFSLTSQSLYDAVVAQRDARPTQDAYQAVIAQRDARFDDSDGDGLTDDKEGQLSTDPSEETVFYLQGFLDDAVSTAQVEAREEVTSNPQAYNLTTVSSYNSVVAQRDARPTQAAYDLMVAQRDARPTQEAYDAVIAERDARFTEDQMHAMSAEPLVGRNAAGNVEVDIAFIASTDLQNFEALDISSEQLSVVNGRVVVEIPPLNNDTHFFKVGIGK